MKLEIIVHPKITKYLEFSQSLKSIIPELRKLCDSIIVIEKSELFSIIIDFKSAEQMEDVLNSKEIRILSGAMAVLKEKSEIIIYGDGYKKSADDLIAIKKAYSKKIKEEININ